MSSLEMGVPVTGVRMLHSHSVDEGAFDREGRVVTFEVHADSYVEGTLIGYTDSEGNECGQEDTELVADPSGTLDGRAGWLRRLHATREAFRMPNAPPEPPPSALYRGRASTESR